MPSNIIPIDILHTQHLAAELLGLDVDAATYDIDAELSKKFNIDLEDFHKLSKALVPFCFAAPLPSENNPSQGFAVIDQEKDKMSWIMQQPIYSNQEKRA